MEQLIKELRKKYTKVFHSMGVPSEEAEETANTLIDACIQEAQREGAMEMIENYGDTLLEMEKSDSGIKRFLDVRRSHGVTDEDIREWWNMSDLERRIIVKIEGLKQIALFRRLRDRGLSQDEAAYGVRKYLPLYGDVDEDSDEHSPLPFELRERVEGYVERRLSEDPDVFSEEVEAFSTFNSFVRSEIKKGNL